MTNELADYRVTFAMRADDEFREFSLIIPATDEKAAGYGAYQIGLGINEASGHVWKFYGDWEPTVEELP